MSWCWDTEQQAAFETILESLLHAPILVLPDPVRPFSVVCDASDFAIGCALTSMDVIALSRLNLGSSRSPRRINLPMTKNFSVHLLGSKAFVVYTDHASLRTATESPHISQRMARLLSFFAE
ncbi:RxLR effector protein [Phytophthora megakarya]|uniref:RxLR effector protein n=1 Tax=Phytophthora megakarya TaxID=4795 RepID=A0A225W7V5_9STRA|nr:RxLR effector protein [Phytophthora megakarya]